MIESDIILLICYVLPLPLPSRYDIGLCPGRLSAQRPRTELRRCVQSGFNEPYHVHFEKLCLFVHVPVDVWDDSKKQNLQTNYGQCLFHGYSAVKTTQLLRPKKPPCSFRKIMCFVYFLLVALDDSKIFSFSKLSKIRYNLMY